jgi:hypothetical protein
MNGIKCLALAASEFAFPDFWLFMLALAGFQLSLTGRAADEFE